MAVLDRFGVYAFPWGTSAPTVDSLVEYAKFAEELGFESVQLPWHFTLPDVRIFPSFGNKVMIDPLVALPAIAAATSRVRIGINAVVLPTIHPFIWTKYFATLDQASQGRVIAGVAVGWWEQDFSAAGVSLRGRGKRMDEALAIMHDLWVGKEITEAGDFYDARGLTIEPRPVQDVPPIWVGGGLKSIDRALKWGSTLSPVNAGFEQVENDYRPALDRAAHETGKRTQLACVNYILVVDDPTELHNYFRPRMLARVNEISVEEVLAAEPGTLREPDELIIWGTAQECATKIQRYFDVGVDYLVIDFNLHGMESEEFGKEQMSRFVNEVVPLLEQG